VGGTTTDGSIRIRSALASHLTRDQTVRQTVNLIDYIDVALPRPGSPDTADTDTGTGTGTDTGTDTGISSGNGAANWAPAGSDRSSPSSPV